MMNLKYLLTKIKYVLLGRDPEILNHYFRKKGMLIGKNSKIYSDITTPESYLIEIGDDVTISTEVQLITHDNSICKLDAAYTDTFGKIKIGSNTFIGARAILLPGVRVGSNVIIGAGSVITKSIPDNVIVAGNPARIIKPISDSSAYVEKYGFNVDHLTAEEKKQLLLTAPERMVIKEEMEWN
ncbi:acetyltransferase [Streptococcus acidominimus]|uniref:Acetyltransferase n=3 Tax=Streptococcus acidominimus TaxID=1326 RepID=A0A380IHY4_STRAI|nr:acetyltransferase [Streptococcus acidominimus]